MMGSPIHFGVSSAGETEMSVRAQFPRNTLYIDDFSFQNGNTSVFGVVQTEGNQGTELVPAPSLHDAGQA